MKALLALPRYPQRFLVEAPFAEWIAAHGGLAAVRSYLLDVPLAPALRDLLNALCEQPGQPIRSYITRLHISERAYSNYLKDLVAVLASALNHWESASAARPASLPAAAAHRRIPTPLTSLVGAESAVAAVCQRIRTPEVRLLTITGPGGMGKTRLAIAAAEQTAGQFPHGACFVPLETTDDASLVHVEIARALGVESNGEKTLHQALLEYLHPRHLLLVLDNFEQVLVAAGLVSEILHAAPSSKIIVTSREPLQIYGEHNYCVPALRLPQDDTLPLDEWQQYAALRLFVERARAANDRFQVNEANLPEVIQICRRLDGLPLAIELAAAGAFLFTPRQILLRLTGASAFLIQGPRDLPPRHQSLWQMLDWSYQLLSPAEQSVFRRLAVFSADFSIEAAAAVTQIPNAAECIEALMRKNLLHPGHADAYAGQLRVNMLQIVREYALQRLAQSGETEATRQRHLACYVALAQRAEDAIGAPEHAQWMAHIHHEHGNLRSALQWALETDRIEPALHLTGCVWRFWQMLNLLSEGRYWLNLALQKSAQVRSLDRVKTLWGAGWLAISQGEAAAVGHPFFEEGLALARALGERRAVGWLLHGLVDTLFSQNQIEASFQAQEEADAIFAALNDEEEIAWGLDMRGRCLLALRRYDEARTNLERAIAVFRRLNHPWGLGWALFHLGDVLQAQGNYTAAQTHLEESLRHLGRFGTHWQLAWALSYTGYNLLLQDRPSQAAPLLARSINLHIEMDNRNGWFDAILKTVPLAIRQRQYAQAVQLEAALRNTPANQTGMLPPQSEVDPIPAGLQTAWQALGAAAYRAAWQAGKQTTLPKLFELSFSILGQQPARQKTIEWR
ncbi:MAG: ATP-binding protein [Chloroflexota bacterium]